MAKEEFECSYGCGKTSPTKAGIKAHERFVHTDAKNPLSKYHKSQKKKSSTSSSSKKSSKSSNKQQKTEEPEKPEEEKKIERFQNVYKKYGKLKKTSEGVRDYQSRPLIKLKEPTERKTKDRVTNQDYISLHPESPKSTLAQKKVTLDGKSLAIAEAMMEEGPFEDLNGVIKYLFNTMARMRQYDMRGIDKTMGSTDLNGMIEKMMAMQMAKQLPEMMGSNNNSSKDREVEILKQQLQQMQQQQMNQIKDLKSMWEKERVQNKYEKELQDLRNSLLNKKDDKDKQLWAEMQKKHMEHMAQLQKVREEQHKRDKDNMQKFQKLQYDHMRETLKKEIDELRQIAQQDEKVTDIEKHLERYKQMAKVFGKNDDKVSRYLELIGQVGAPLFERLIDKAGSNNASNVSAEDLEPDLSYDPSPYTTDDVIAGVEQELQMQDDNSFAGTTTVQADALSDVNLAGQTQTASIDEAPEEVSSTKKTSKPSKKPEIDKVEDDLLSIAYNDKSA